MGFTGTIIDANSGFGGGFSQVLVDVVESGALYFGFILIKQLYQLLKDTLFGSSTKNKTSVSFIRIGDT